MKKQRSTAIAIQIIPTANRNVFRRPTTFATEPPRIGPTIPPPHSAASSSMKRFVRWTGVHPTLTSAMTDIALENVAVFPPVNEHTSEIPMMTQKPSMPNTCKIQHFQYKSEHLYCKIHHFTVPGTRKTAVAKVPTERKLRIIAQRRPLESAIEETIPTVSAAGMACARPM